MGQDYVMGFPIEIRGKANHLRWTRDGWLTDGRWALKDFFTHGWKMDRRNRSFARWINSLVPTKYGTGFDMHKCGTKRVTENWPYKDTFIRTDKEISEIIRKRIKSAKDHYEIVLAENKNFENGLIGDNYDFWHPFL